MTETPAPVQVDGDADAPTTVLGLDGEPKNFLAAKRADRPEQMHLRRVRGALPDGSISREDPAEVTRACASSAMPCAELPDGPVFERRSHASLSHKAMLERDHRRAPIRYSWQAVESPVRADGGTLFFAAKVWRIPRRRPRSAVRPRRWTGRSSHPPPRRSRWPSLRLPSTCAAGTDSYARWRLAR